jgi:pimeloyl-ACP methyl ester carboxylesterase
MIRTLLFFLLIAGVCHAQSIQYPAPVQYLNFTIEDQAAKMAYMDVPAQNPNGATVLLLHGKNFNGFYWKDVIQFLSSNGYRVIVPDQVGWGRSDKPNIHYSFHLLAYNTKRLLDTLGIDKVHVIGHSMGGMLATRFALMFPQTVQKLIYENPIGLEDYKTFVPYQPIEKLFENERKGSYGSYKAYQQSYYPVWKPEYEQYVMAQLETITRPDSAQAAWANALTFQMIYEQPVVYEFINIKQPTLIIIGQEDRTIVGKSLLSKEVAATHGNYPAMGKMLRSIIKDSKLVELKGVGHIPHIQTPGRFQKEVLEFLK